MLLNQEFKYIIKQLLILENKLFNDVNNQCYSCVVQHILLVEAFIHHVLKENKNTTYPFLQDTLPVLKKIHLSLSKQQKIDLKLIQV